MPFSFVSSIFGKAHNVSVINHDNEWISESEGRGDRKILGRQTERERGGGGVIFRTRGRNVCERERDRERETERERNIERKRNREIERDRERQT